MNPIIVKLLEITNLNLNLPCILRLWKRGEPKKEFLMVCRRVLHGMFCIEGESGGVCAGGSMEGTFRGGNFGLFIGDTAGLTLCKLFFRLQNTGIVRFVYTERKQTPKRHHFHIGCWKI